MPTSSTSAAAPIVPTQLLPIVPTFHTTVSGEFECGCLPCVCICKMLNRETIPYLPYCTEDEESFNSFLPPTFYLKMVVVVVVVHIA